MSDLIIHIGFSKSASTYLQSHFRTNRELDYLEKTGFLNRNIEEVKRVDYLNLFSDDARTKLESDEHIILPSIHPDLGVKGTRMSDVEKMIAKLEHLKPIKILIVLRDHHSLIRSRYSQYVVTGGKESFVTFSKLIQQASDGNDYLENYYGRIIDDLFKSFGKESVHVIRQEELYSNGSEIESDLKEFLGVSEWSAVSSGIKQRRKGLSDAGISILRRINQLVVWKKETPSTRVESFFGSRGYGILVIIIRLLDQWFMRHIKLGKSSMEDAKLRKQLHEKFRVDSELLRDLLSKV